MSFPDSSNCDFSPSKQPDYKPRFLHPRHCRSIISRSFHHCFIFFKSCKIVNLIIWCPPCNTRCQTPILPAHHKQPYPPPFYRFQSDIVPGKSHIPIFSPMSRMRSPSAAVPVHPQIRSLSLDCICRFLRL